MYGILAIRFYSFSLVFTRGNMIKHTTSLSKKQFVWKFMLKWRQKRGKNIRKQELKRFITKLQHPIHVIEYPSCYASPDGGRRKRWGWFLSPSHVCVLREPLKGESAHHHCIQPYWRRIQEQTATVPVIDQLLYYWLVPGEVTFTVVFIYLFENGNRTFQIGTLGIRCYLFILIFANTYLKSENKIV